MKVGRESSVGIATRYGLDGPGIESRWGEIFRTCPDRPWSPISLLYNGYLVFPGVKSGRSVTLTPHPLLVPWSWMDRAIPLLPLWAVRPVQSLSACTTVTFTFLPLLLHHTVRRITKQWHTLTLRCFWSETVSRRHCRTTKIWVSRVFKLHLYCRINNKRTSQND